VTGKAASGDGRSRTDSSALQETPTSTNAMLVTAMERAPGRMVPPSWPNARPVGRSLAIGSHERAPGPQPGASLSRPAAFSRGTAQLPPRGRSPDSRIIALPSLPGTSVPVASSGSLPGHSGATVPDFHRLPSSARAGCPPARATSRSYGYWQGFSLSGTSGARRSGSSVNCEVPLHS
jgi:hypothetical protein